MIRTLVPGLLSIGLAFAGPASHAAAGSLEADYSVSIRGLPVGKASLRAEIADQRYSAAFSGGISGLARLFARISAEAQSTGLIGGERPRAAEYSHVWVEDDDAETVSMHFRGDGVDEIAIDPPIKRPERYVPMTAAAKADAVDLVSSFLWPTDAGAAPQTCQRTLPLIDGRRRFNIQSAFSRMESFSTRSGSHFYRAVVCALSYEPVAGQRKDKKKDGFLSEGGDMEVWLVSAGDGLAAPVKVLLTSKYGRVVMQATRFEAK